MRFLAENLLPFYLTQNKNCYSEVKHMHTLCYLLSQKVQLALTSPAIRSCMDNFWDLKALVEV